MAAPPVLVVMNGPPGVGKSTLAWALGERLDLEVVSKDRIKERPYLQASLDERGGVGASRRLGGEAFDELFRRMRRALRGGQWLILDAPFWPAMQDERFRRLATDMRCCVAQVWVRASVETVRRRRLLRLGARHPAQHGLDAVESRASIARSLEARLRIEPTLEADGSSREGLERALEGTKRCWAASGGGRARVRSGHDDDLDEV